MRCNILYGNELKAFDCNEFEKAVLIRNSDCMMKKAENAEKKEFAIIQDLETSKVKAYKCSKSVSLQVGLCGAFREVTN